MLVTPDAPALRENWHTTWLDSIKAEWQPGRYVRKGTNPDGLEYAKWSKL